MRLDTREPMLGYKKIRRSFVTHDLQPLRRQDGVRQGGGGGPMFESRLFEPEGTP